MTIAAIDFARLYRDHLAAANRNPKPASAWDARAGNLQRRMLKGSYMQDFIARMDLSDARTLLDVGCGPGTICLPLATQMERVIGMDYSQGMLDALMANAAERGLVNVQPLLRAWEDDWSDIPECDIVVASRSTTVEDIATALEKLHAKARRRVYLTHLVGGLFTDVRIARAVGRTPMPLPDYVYLINILHRMGIHPRLDYITVENRLAGAADFDDYVRRVAWSLGELTPDERERLHRWYIGASPQQRMGEPMRWAFISWEKQAP